MKKVCFKNVVKEVNFYFEGWECRFNFLTGEKYFPRTIALSEAGNTDDCGYIWDYTKIKKRNESLSRTKRAGSLYIKGLKKIFRSYMKLSICEQMTTAYVKRELNDVEERWKKILCGFTTNQIIQIGEGKSFKVYSYVDGTFDGEIIK